MLLHAVKYIHKEEKNKRKCILTISTTSGMKAYDRAQLLHHCIQCMYFNISDAKNEIYISLIPGYVQIKQCPNVAYININLRE